MAQVVVYDMMGKILEEKAVSDAFLAKDIKYQAIKTAVLGYLAHQRQGNASTKTRGEISGSGRKPWKQKGTGRARVGSRSNPVWRGGGTTFGPKPHMFAYKVPKKTKKQAKESALRIRLRDEKVLLVRDLKLEASKTKAMVEVFDRLKLNDQTVLVITQDTDRNIYLACRNIKKADVITLADINAYEILRHRKILFMEEAFNALMVTVGEN